MAEALSESAQKNMRSAKSEVKRLKKTFKESIKRELALIPVDPKDMEVFLEGRKAGNDCIAKKQYKRALRHYNVALLNCPQDTEEGKENLCIMLGNRTAINFALKNYENIFDDVDYINAVQHYPAKYEYKLVWRQAMSQAAMGNLKLAGEAYDQTIRSLVRETDLEGEELDNLVRIIQNEKKDMWKKPVERSTSQAEAVQQPEMFGGSEKYPHASPLIEFKYDDHQGRYAVAKRDIPIGTLILQEEPHAATVELKHALMYCLVCFKRVEQFVVCSRCKNVVYCTIACLKEAEKSFHGIECPIYPTLIRRFDVLLALRMLTQRGYSYFADQKEKFVQFLNSGDQGLTNKDVYLSDDYENIPFLYWNREKMQDQSDFITAVYLLRMLKTTSFFPFETEPEVFREEEIFIARLILRHCKIMSYNAHGINELDYYRFKGTTTDTEEYLNDGIGVGLYPTLALFNHSCEPSIIRYNNKKQVFVRTMKPIRAGDIIYDNYGPHYLHMRYDRRQMKLQEEYFFSCVCPACENKWPTIDAMEVVFKFPCKTTNCDYVFSMTYTKKPRRCLYCRRAPIPSDVQAITERLVTNYEAAEKLFSDKDYDAALKAYKTILEYKYRYTNEPDLEIVKIQERLEEIFARNGNTNPSLHR